MPQTENRTIPTFKSSLYPTLLIVAVWWIIHLLSYLTQFETWALGIRPRNPSGLIGILTSPFLHGDLAHLISNSVPFIICGTIMLLFYRRSAAPAVLFMYVLTGFLVWLFAKENTSHIGASGVVYGMMSYLFWSGVFRRNLRSVVLSLAIVLLYSGSVVGLFPGEAGISWESHLLGAAVGLVAAFLFRNKIEFDEEEEPPTPPELKRNYFEEDPFEGLLEQRHRDQN